MKANWENFKPLSDRLFLNSESDHFFVVQQERGEGVHRVAGPYDTPLKLRWIIKATYDV